MTKLSKKLRWGDHLLGVLYLANIGVGLSTGGWMGYLAAGLWTAALGFQLQVRRHRRRREELEDVPEMRLLGGR